MAGIYLHIPFCKQACYYCDFHFSTKLDKQQQLIDMMLLELEREKDYFERDYLERDSTEKESIEKESIQTIYFGGGTPSLLTEKQLNSILETITKHYNLADSLEITLEANPDDLTKQKLQAFKNVGINRLSIGIQSFHDEHLKLMNRAHNSVEAQECVVLAQDAGFEDISIDLIYGIPADSNLILEKDINLALSLQVPHISAYCLTIEMKTVFGSWERKGKITVDEFFQAEQFEIVSNQLQANGYEQYEISNFAKNECYSKHNTAYWQQKKYLGIGPSAHSYDQTARRYNVSDNAKYMKAIADKTTCFEEEILSPEDNANEYLLTTLRTKWGTSIEKLESYCSGWKKDYQRLLTRFEKERYITIKDNHIYLTEEGKIVADFVTESLAI